MWMSILGHDTPISGGGNGGSGHKLGWCPTIHKSEVESQHSEVVNRQTRITCMVEGSGGGVLVTLTKMQTLAKRS